MKIFKRILIIIGIVAAAFVIGYCVYTWGAAK